MKVVVAEDNDRHREALVEQLTRHGAFVVGVASGSEVPALVDDIGPDIVILDMRLPGKDGLSLVGELRRKPGGERLYVLALTANAFAQDRQKALEAGFDAFLAKPYDEADLIRILESQPRTPYAGAPPPSDSDDDTLSKLKKLLHDVRGLVKPGIAERWKQIDRDAMSNELNAVLTMVGGRGPDRPQVLIPWPAQRPRLLIVENDLGQSQHLTEVFTGLGYDVSSASGESEVLEALRRGSFTAYLIDLRLGDVSGIDLVKKVPQYMDPKRNVVFMSVAPGLFASELSTIEAPRVYDKTSNAVERLIQLTREVAPLHNNALIAEQDVTRAGSALLSEVQSRLAGTTIDIALDTNIAVLCRDYGLAVAANPSRDLNKYLIGSDYLLRCLGHIESPLMHMSRKACLEAYWRLRAKWLWGSRSYGTWLYEAAWGVLTGHGQSVARIVGTLIVVVIVATSLLALWPGTVAFSVNGTPLKDVPPAQRWWISLYIAASNSLLVGAESILPTSTAAQALVLSQTIMSLILVGMAVGALLSRFRSGA